MSLAKYIILMAFIAVVFFSSCSHSEWRHTAGAAWGTTYHITYNSDKDLADSVVAEMRLVELSLSTFDQASTIAKINSGQTDSVDELFTEVFTIAKEVYNISNGAFDPTVGPLTNLWGFGHKKVTQTPDSLLIENTLESVGFDQCHINNGIIVRKNPNTEFDFAAIAKGYGVDRVAQMLKRNGTSDFMVEIGGEVITSGNNPTGKKWRIQIDAPSSNTPGDSALQVISLTDQAVATSGNYRNYRLHANGVKYGHTINPKTGYPSTIPTLSVTVIARSCILADALATACMAMHPDSAISMIQKYPETQAIIVIPDKNRYKILSTE